MLLITGLCAALVVLLLGQPGGVRRLVGPGTAPARRPKTGRRRTRREPRTPELPGPLLLELLASLLESGAPPSAAVRTAGAVLASHGDARADELLGLAVALEQGIPMPTGAARTDTARTGISRTGGPAGSDTARTGISRASGPAGSDTARTGISRARGAASSDTALDTLADALGMAQRAGLPPAALVRRAADEDRRRVSATRRRAVRRMEVLLVLPVGLCLLPAFVLLGIVPVVIDLFAG